jgi:predicted deacetylase
MKVNISIDDVSPHPLSSIKVAERCFELIEEFKDIKFTLFVPISYWRTIKDIAKTNKPLPISEYPEFCQFLRDLPKNNFEICYHGFYHGIPGKSDNDEFQNLDYKSAFEKFSQMVDVVKQSNMEEVFKPIFRPPAWRMSPEAIKAAKDFGFKTLALSKKDYANQTYMGEDKAFGNVVYYDCNPPFDELRRFENNEIVYHACEWDKNYLSKELKNELSEWLKIQDTVQYEFIEGLIDEKS